MRERRDSNPRPLVPFDIVSFPPVPSGRAVTGQQRRATYRFQRYWQPVPDPLRSSLTWLTRP